MPNVETRPPKGSPLAAAKPTAVFPVMSLRDYFAARALPGLLATLTDDHAISATATARQAYEIADAMLAEREKGGPTSSQPASAPEEERTL